jgi:hypothetical protein
VREKSAASEPEKKAEQARRRTMERRYQSKGQDQVKRQKSKVKRQSRGDGRNAGS